jgi:AcrR family transcriptional regulator
MPRLWDETIEAHRREVRGAILDTTASLIQEHGLRSVTMSQIAEHTGIGRATLYKYFADVEAIVAAWQERHAAAYLEQFSALHERLGGSAERLSAVLEHYAIFQYKSHAAHIGEIVQLGGHRVLAQQQLRGLIQDLMMDAAGTGDVRTDVAPDELVSYCLNALDGAASAPTEAAVRRLVRVTLTGLRIKTPAESSPEAGC